MYSSIDTAPLCKILEQSDHWPTIIHGDIEFSRIGEYKCHHECSLGVNLVIDNFLHVASDSSRTISHGDIASNRFGGYKSVVNECSLGVNLVIDFLFV